MQLEIGVFGSAEPDCGTSLVGAAQAIGETIAQRGHIISTGACLGLPFEAVKRAKECGGYSIGYTAVTAEQEHESAMKTSASQFDRLELIPGDYEYKDNIYVCRKYRNVSSVAACDGAIFISGRWGTLNEFSIAYDTGKVMGVLTGQGKFSNCVESLVERFGKATKGTILFNDDPSRLVEDVVDRCLEIRNS